MDHRFYEISLLDPFKIVIFKIESIDLFVELSWIQLKLYLVKRDTDELYITSCNLILCNITVPRLNNMGIEEVQSEPGLWKYIEIWVWNTLRYRCPFKIWKFVKKNL